MILAQMPLEYLDQDIEMDVGLTEMLLGALLGGGQVADGAADEAREPDQPFRDAVSLRGELFQIRIELRLLMQQELHHAIALLRGHRLKVHEKPSVSRLYGHYAIVESMDK